VAADGSLVYVTYLADVEEENRRIGRSWGVFHRKTVPWAERRVVKLFRGEWEWEARALAREQWAGVPDYSSSGFTLFVENSYLWADAIEAIQKGNFCRLVEPEGGA